MEAQMIAIVFLLLSLLPANAGEQTRFYDGQGRSVGTATRDSGGMTTFRDERGRTTGTATTDSGGTTTFRDGRGNVTGRATGPTQFEGRH